jgi:hypothetical protein
VEQGVNNERLNMLARLTAKKQGLTIARQAPCTIL